MDVAVIALSATALLAAFAAGVLACWWRMRPELDRLVALVDQQHATLTAVPESAQEHRAAAEAWRAKQIGRIDAYYLDQRRAAA